LIKLWVAEKKTAGATINLPTEFFFSTVEIGEDALKVGGQLKKGPVIL
jgi:hypothetical protein